MVGLRTLTPSAGVRIPLPQPKKEKPGIAGLFFGWGRGVRTPAINNRFDPSAARTMRQQPGVARQAPQARSQSLSPSQKKRSPASPGFFWLGERGSNTREFGAPVRRGLWSATPFTFHLSPFTFQPFSPSHDLLSPSNTYSLSRNVKSLMPGPGYSLPDWWLRRVSGYYKLDHVRTTGKASFSSGIGGQVWKFVKKTRAWSSGRPGWGLSS